MPCLEAMFLAALEQDGWRPGIGDPTFLGWFTVAAYFVASCLTLRAWRAETRRRAQGQPRSGELFWGAMFLLITALGVNKQLDLQTWFTEVGRHLAYRHNWYDQRRRYQFVFVLCLGAAGAVCLFLLYRLTRTTLARNRLALMGAAFLVFFVFIRAASFHHFDQFIQSSFAGMRWNGILELGGIACVGWAANQARKQGAGK